MSESNQHISIHNSPCSILLILYTPSETKKHRIGKKSYLAWHGLHHDVDDDGQAGNNNRNNNKNTFRRLGDY
jgi:hypothetical protein